MRDYPHITEKLQGLKPYKDGFMARCPAHEDNRSSLSVKVGDGGGLLLNCFAGCSFAEIIDALGVTASDCFPEREKTVSKEVASYDYTDEAGLVLFQVVRFDPKEFRQRRLENGQWVWGMGESRRVLYRLERLAKEKDRIVFIVEGEKDVHTLERHGFLATTSPMGAGKWRDEYSMQLAGRTCVVIPDNDLPGVKHAGDAARGIVEVGKGTACILGLNAKDISEWFTNPGNSAAILQNMAKIELQRQAQLNKAKVLTDEILPMEKHARWFAVRKLLESLEEV